MNQNQPTRQQALGDPIFPDRLHEDFDQAIALTLELVEEHAGHAIAEQRALSQEEKGAILAANACLDRPAVTGADLLDMVQPDAEWFDPDTLDEGIENHAIYHAGRPEECGLASACPGMLTLSPPEDHP